MKKFFLRLTLGLLSLALFSCSDSLTEKNDLAFLALAARSESGQYGSIVVNDSRNSRALDVSSFDSVTVTVSGFGMEDIVKENVSASDGKGEIRIDGILVGKNRVVTVEADSDGAVIRALVDIEKDVVKPCSVNWDSTAVAGIFYNLIKADVDVSSINNTYFDSYIPEVHASLVDVESIAADYKGGTLSSADSYILDCGTVTVNAYNVDGYTVQITDPATKKTEIDGSADSEKSYSLDAYPGTWKAKIFDANGELAGEEDIAVVSGKTSTVTLSYSAGSDVTGKIIVHVPSDLGYTDIWAWSTTSLSVNYTGGTWPGKSMTLNGSYYDYELDYTSSKIIFNDSNKGNTVGTNQTNNLYLTEGEWNYIGDKSGTTDTDGSKIASNFTKVQTEPVFSFTVENPPVAMKPTVKANYSDGDEIDVNGSVKFTVTSKNTALTSGTYTVGTKTGTLSIGENTVDLPSGLADGDRITVSARVANSEGEASLSITLKVAEIAEPSIPTRLGASYEKCGTSFSIWSPASSNVKVAVKKQGESNFTEYTCTKGFTVNGGYSDSTNIYGITLKGDYRLAEYQFYIGGKAVRDPYGKMVKYEDADAKTNLIKANYSESNCKVSSYAGSSINIVMDTDSILPTKGYWYDRPALPSRAASVVYEIHVGDFTVSPSWHGTESHRGKFKGVTESGTTYTENSRTVATGLDHLIELGVTHVQIMPMYDYATKYNHTLGEYYNWGYDPVNYNVPEDRFAEDPTNYEERIREVKDMVNILHDKGIRVIMDVVYNHTFDGEMFNNISSKYYTSKDLSGCGNSVDVSNAMVSRMVRDSLEYWLTTFNLDGFRFDLMGIYKKDAVGDWGKYLNSNYGDRTLLLYGEPYAANHDDTANRVYANAIPDLEYAGIGAFSHKYRETVKGGSDDGIKGYMFNATEKDGDSTVRHVEVGLKGSAGSASSDVWTRYFTKQTYQAVNYLSAHDNLCLYDKIVRSGITTSNSAYQQALVKFGHGIVVLSQGVGFLHGGDDFLRTKGGYTYSEMLIDTRTAKENSYMFGWEMNQIDWSRKAKYYDVFKYNKDLIAFKKAHNGFYNGNASTSSDGMTIYYKITDSSGKKYTCVFNPGSDITYNGGGTQVFNKSGIVLSGSSDSHSYKCEGTGVTIFEQ